MSDNDGFLKPEERSELSCPTFLKPIDDWLSSFTLGKLWKQHFIFRLTFLLYIVFFVLLTFFLYFRTMTSGNSIEDVFTLIVFVCLAFLKVWGMSHYKFFRYVLILVAFCLTLVIPFIIVMKIFSP